MAQRTITITADEQVIATAYNGLVEMARVLNLSADMQEEAAARPKSKNRRDNFAHSSPVEVTRTRADRLMQIAEQLVAD